MSGTSTLTIEDVVDVGATYLLTSDYISRKDDALTGSEIIAAIDAIGDLGSTGWRLVDDYTVGDDDGIVHMVRVALPDGVEWKTLPESLREEIVCKAAPCFVVRGIAGWLVHWPTRRTSEGRMVGAYCHDVPTARLCQTGTALGNLTTHFGEWSNGYLYLDRWDDDPGSVTVDWRGDVTMDPDGDDD